MSVTLGNKEFFPGIGKINFEGVGSDALANGWGIRIKKGTNTKSKLSLVSQYFLSVNKTVLALIAPTTLLICQVG